MVNIPALPSCVCENIISDCDNRQIHTSTSSPWSVVYVGCDSISITRRIRSYRWSERTAPEIISGIQGGASQAFNAPGCIPRDNIVADGRFGRANLFYLNTDIVSTDGGICDSWPTAVLYQYTDTIVIDS